MTPCGAGNLEKAKRRPPLPAPLGTRHRHVLGLVVVRHVGQGVFDVSEAKRAEEKGRDHREDSTRIAGRQSGGESRSMVTCSCVREQSSDSMVEV